MDYCWECMLGALMTVIFFAIGYLGLGLMYDKIKEKFGKRTGSRFVLFMLGVVVMFIIYTGFE